MAHKITFFMEHDVKAYTSVSDEDRAGTVTALGGWLAGEAGYDEVWTDTDDSGTVFVPRSRVVAVLVTKL